MGLIRRIGDGTSTRVWEDRWIPMAIGNKPICRRDGGTAIHVCDLMTPDGRDWDVEALEHNLIPMDAEAVRRIPLGHTRDDFWAWSEEKHGLYIVRSAYRMLARNEAQQRHFDENRAAHSASMDDPMWKMLWKCKVPPKVRVFWWRVAHEFLPSRANLHRRHMEPLGTCETCGAQAETSFHALTECTYARAFWQRLKELTGVKLPLLNQRTRVIDLLDGSLCSELERNIILCGMWSIWQSRNDRHHGKKEIQLKLAIDWATDVCLQLMSAVSQKPNEHGRVVCPSWSPPPPGQLKVNTDAAFSKDELSGATGAVVRRDDGSFVKAAARRLPSVASALIAEAEACRDGIRLVSLLPAAGIILETDSLEFVSAWMHRQQQRSEIVSILEDIQVVAADFSYFEVRHVHRMANKLAHVCASHASSCNI
ncbi:hypothetical protein HU200_013821 [Digitaria exilis]|uniref:Reverse transcriptase zinc-binding domain-containing protein n=1 Tax=Digitaria exilis TaxID=1010633 RepID=A0A835FCF8_9POAL|nr:hypothetical protein HU200_013821 [Digitaria exilis]